MTLQLLTHDLPPFAYCAVATSKVFLSDMIASVSTLKAYHLLFLSRRACRSLITGRYRSGLSGGRASLDYSFGILRFATKSDHTTLVHPYGSQ